MPPLVEARASSTQADEGICKNMQNAVKTMAEIENRWLFGLLGLEYTRRQGDM